ncbi:Flavodoxin [Lacticaseibacillus brantae DSM 23927]|uniref:Flavodoxin n=2 Tax=Lacticaseibacillus brantae TaxID=943673 RepID=A0A0R2AYB2_9LACO|nr:Flavodoxin [Lacticaseibacillus brantae DSM 23927]
MARVLQQYFEYRNIDVTMAEMQQTAAESLKEYDAVALATYTWTGGTIPEETEDFFLDLSATDFSQKPLIFGVVGTGDPYYGEDYNTAPALFTANLRASGAIQGATTVKIEQGVSDETMPLLVNFAKELITSVEKL